MILYLIMENNTMVFQWCLYNFQMFCKTLSGRWIMLVVAIINSAVAILLVAHVMTCFWYFVGRQVENEGRQSWLSLEGANDKDPFTQYLHAFRYIMDAPSPPVITADSDSDQIVYVFFEGCPVVLNHQGVKYSLIAMWF